MKKILFICFVMGMPCLGYSACEPPTDCEAFKYAKYAEKVYRDNSEGAPFDLGCPQLGLCLPSVHEVGGGLYVEVFKRNDEYVIAFRGTQEDQDLIDDVDQALNGHNEQFAQAKNYFQLIDEALNKCGATGKRTLVGHSLGGALAQYVGENAGDKYKVVTFNPAALLPDDRSGPANPPCVFNYVNGNDILHRVVNPLLAEAAQVEQEGLNACKLNNVASAYIGTNITVGGEEQSFNFKNTLTKEDVAELRDVAQDFPEIQEFIATGILNVILNSDRLDWIISRMSRIKGLSKVFARIDPQLATDWGILCSEANAIVPIKIGLIFGPNVQPFLLGAARKFQMKFSEVLGESIDAHSIGKVMYAEEVWTALDPANIGRTPAPAVYTPGSMLDLLQAKCENRHPASSVAAPIPGDGAGVLPQTPGSIPATMPVSTPMFSQPAAGVQGSTTFFMPPNNSPNSGGQQINWAPVRPPTVSSGSGGAGVGVR